MALLELLINAIEHGNCQISFEEKSAWLEAGKNIFDLIRAQEPRPRDRRAQGVLPSTASPADARSSPSATRGTASTGAIACAEINDKNYLKLHGRGILMAEHY